MINSPFEQFELSLFLPIKFTYNNINFDFSITTTTIYLIIAFSIILFFLLASIYKSTIIPNNWQSLVELIYKFILGLITEQSGLKGKRYFPVMFVIFIFILTLNLIGLIPWGFTVTSHIIITFTLAFSMFLALTLIGFKEQKLNFFKLFVPSGVPNWLLPLLIIIEIMSYSLRPLSLSIRLFANMLAGHVLLHIIAGAAVLVFSKSLLLFLLPWSFILIFNILELGIACLQAYVFTILLCIYLYDSLYGH